MKKKKKTFAAGDKEKTNKFADTISKASESRIYINESDHPVEVFAGGPAQEVTRAEILKQTGHGENDPTEEISLEDFFDRLTQLRDWYGDRERETAKRYAELKNNWKNLSMTGAFLELEKYR